MKINEILQHSGQMFDLDGTLTNSINFPKDIRLVKNFLRLEFGTLSLKPGALEFIKTLQEHDKRLALVSNMSESLLKKYLNSNTINSVAPFKETFETIKITGTDKRQKSDLILETLDEWKMENDQAIYYGDTLKDAIACNDAGVRFCLIGSPQEKDLREIQKISQYRIQSFDDLNL